MELKDLRRNSQTVNNGMWVKDIPGMDDLELMVRGMTAPSVVFLRSRKERKVPRNQKEQDGTIRPETALRIMRETLAEAVLLDWKNFTENGKPIPYSKALATKLLLDPNTQPFADAVSWAASAVDRGGIDPEEMEEAKNNLGEYSDGTSPSDPTPNS